SRSADHTNGLASGTRRVSSLTSRTPGTASTEPTALCRPSSEKASAPRVTSASNGAVLVQAAKAQRRTKGITPGHHLLLHLKSPRIRYPRGELPTPLRDSFRRRRGTNT